MKKIIFFDFDGVIVDSFDLSFGIHKKIYKGETEDGYRARFNGNILKSLKKKGPFSGDREAKKFFSAYEKGLMKHDCVPGMKAVIKKLAEDHQLVVVSSTIGKIIGKFFKKNGLDKYFTDILGSESHHDKTEKIKRILKKYQADADNCLFITDTLGDIREARKAGVQSVAVAWGFHGRELLENEVASAVAETPEQILKMVEDKIVSVRLYERILDVAPMSIITIDKEGFVTSANQYYLNFSKNKDFRSHNIFSNDFFIRENLVDDYKNLLAKGTVVQKEQCYERNNRGEDKYLKIIAVPLRDKKGRIEGALSMAVDNTEAIVFKNELQDLNKNLESIVRQRTEELDKVNAELDKALKMKSDFMADISHEVRTSLAIIQLNLEVIAQKMEVSMADKEEYDDVYEEIKRMKNMMADLSTLAAADSAKQKLNLEKINIGRMVSSACQSLRLIAEEKGVKIKFNKPRKDTVIIADKSKMEKLVMNLAKNAIRYNRPGGWVKIVIEKSKSEILLKFEDNGIGMAKSHLSKIFDRFYRVDRHASRSEGGSGLGLAICRWVAEIHGGSIDVASRSGKGSCFTVRLPIRGPRKI